VARGQQPIQAHKLIGQWESTAREQGGEANTEEALEGGEIETPCCRSLLATPLFWIATVGWTLALILTVVVFLLAS